MKKAGIFLAVLAVVLSSCSTNPTRSEEGNKPTEIGMAKAQGVMRETAPAMAAADMDALVDGNIQFALDMYDQIISGSGMNQKNTFFSPYSLTVALAMTLAGAEGKTEQQMHDALRFALQEPDLHRALNQLDISMETAAANQDNLTLSVVNTIWGRCHKEFELTFLDVLARNYGAGLNLLDFAGDPEGSRIIINTWVEEQTNSKIKDLLPNGSIKSSTALVLTNAIYFLADWQMKFDPDNTVDAPFYLQDGGTKEVPLMSLSSPDEKPRVLTAITQKSKAVQLPYIGNRFALLAILPKNGTLAEYEQGFDAAELDEIVNALDSNEIEVKIPRFTFGTPSIQVNDALIALGMEDAFSSESDFSGIDGTRNLAISNVFHKAFISVDEKGAEAAAATAVVIVDRSAMVDPNFIADRPFIYLIRDCETGAVLFMGRVMDPTDEGE